MSESQPEMPLRAFFRASFAAALGLTLALPVSAQPRRQRQAAPPAVTPQDEEARLLFDAGERAYTEGRFDAALSRFREAYELSHRPTLLFNIGQAEERMRHDAEALAAFRAYLEAVPNASNRTWVESRIEILARVVAEREATVPTPEQVAQAEVVAEPRHEGSTQAVDTQHKSRWWIYTLVAVAVAGLAVGIAVPLARDDGSSIPRGDVGGPIQARLGR